MAEISGCGLDWNGDCRRHSLERNGNCRLTSSEMTKNGDWLQTMTWVGVRGVRVGNVNTKRSQLPKILTAQHNCYCIHTNTISGLTLLLYYYYYTQT